MLSHAPEYADGNRSRELFTRLTGGGPVSFGELAVDGFFLLSGYLIVQSWSLDPRLGDFLQKRVLRIVPGFVVAAVFSVLATGLLAPAVPHFFPQLWSAWPADLRATLLVGTPIAPPVFPHLSFHSVNGPLWTIPYEFRCYLLVALLGLCGAVRRPRIWAALTAALFVLFLLPRLQTALSWHTHIPYLGEPLPTFRLFATYLLGGLFYLAADRIRFRRRYAILAVVLLLASRLSAQTWQPGLVLCGGYLLFYLGRLPVRYPACVLRFPDISYGLYLYAGVVEALWLNFFKADPFAGSPWTTFAASAAIASALGWLSWHAVERPMLRLKRHGTVALPPP